MADDVKISDQELYALGFKRERHNTSRARAFDEARVVFETLERNWAERQVQKFMVECNLSEAEAKALLVVALLFFHMKPDEQDHWIRKGETIRSKVEWEEINRRRLVLREVMA